MYEAIALAALEVVGEAMKMFPDYEQRKIEKFHKLREEFESERKKPYGVRNDQLYMDLGDQLRIYVEDFSKILTKQSVASVQKT